MLVVAMMWENLPKFPRIKWNTMFYFNSTSRQSLNNIARTWTIVFRIKNILLFNKMYFRHANDRTFGTPTLNVRLNSHHRDINHRPLNSKIDNTFAPWPKKNSSFTNCRIKNKTKFAIDLIYAYSHVPSVEESFALTCFLFGGNLYALIRNFFRLEGLRKFLSTKKTIIIFWIPFKYF